MSILSRRLTRPPQRHSPGTWRRPQPVLHIVILFCLLVSLVPIYLMFNISFKTPLQFLDDRWLPTFPLRLGNYAAAWEIIHPYILNTGFVAGAGLSFVLLMSLIGGHVFAHMRFPFREQLYYGIIILLAVPFVLSFIP